MHIRQNLPAGSSSLLFTAVASGNIEMVQLFLNNHVNPNVFSGADKQSPLQYAITNDLTEIALLLIGAGAKANDSLHLAIEKCNFLIIKALVSQHPYLLNEQNAVGKTPLFLATEFMQEDIVEYLLAQGASPNCLFQQQTPLICALQNDQEKIACMLIAARANPDLGIISAEVAAKMKKCLAAQHSPQIESPCRLAALGDFESIKNVLEDHPELLDSIDDAGKTALYYAAENGNADMVEWLLRKGANPNIWVATDDDRFLATPLYCAVKRGHVKVVEKFTQLGFTLDKTAYTSIHLALKNDDLETFKCLIEQHPRLLDAVDTETENPTGKYPLEVAASLGKVEFVKFLLSKGADVNKCFTSLGFLNVLNLFAWNLTLLSTYHQEILTTIVKAGYQHPQLWVLMRSAVQYRKPEIIKAIIENNSDLLDVDEIRTQIFILLAEKISKEDILAITKLILEKRPQFFLKKNDEQPVLHWVVTSGRNYRRVEPDSLYLELLALFIEKKVDVNEFSLSKEYFYKNGIYKEYMKYQNALTLAAWSHSEIAVLMLIQAGALTSANGKRCSEWVKSYGVLDHYGTSDNLALKLLKQIEKLDQFIFERATTASKGKSHSKFVSLEKSLLKYHAVNNLRRVIVDGLPRALLDGYKKILQKSKTFKDIYATLDVYESIHMEIKKVKEKIKTLLKDQSTQNTTKNSNSIAQTTTTTTTTTIAQATTIVIPIQTTTTEEEAIAIATPATTEQDTTQVVPIQITKAEATATTEQISLYPSTELLINSLQEAETTTSVETTPALIDLTNCEPVYYNLNTLHEPFCEIPISTNHATLYGQKTTGQTIPDEDIMSDLEEASEKKAPPTPPM